MPIRSRVGLIELALMLALTTIAATACQERVPATIGPSPTTAIGPPTEGPPVAPATGPPARPSPTIEIPPPQ